MTLSDSFPIGVYVLLKRFYTTILSLKSGTPPWILGTYDRGLAGLSYKNAPENITLDILRKWIWGQNLHNSEFFMMYIWTFDIPVRCLIRFEFHVAHWILYTTLATDQKWLFSYRLPKLWNQMTERAAFWLSK